MDLNELWHDLQKEVDTIKSEVNAEHHAKLDKSLEAIKTHIEKFFNEQVTPGFEFPHPRSRIYRNSPRHWSILDTTHTNVLHLILEQKKNCLRQAAVIFDLDGTLFDVGPRTLGIMNEWLASNNARIFDPSLLKKIAKINYSHVGYSIAHAFENAGFDLRNKEVAELFSSVENLWKKKFFDGTSLLKYDSLIPGSIEFVKKVYDAGIHVVYLTGRHGRTMTEGTRKQLEKFSFPTLNTSIFLKDNVLIEDQIFKSECVKQVQKQYDVIGNFENEYINVAYMALEIPKAINVIVDSHHSGRPVPKLDVQVYRIFGFTEI